MKSKHSLMVISKISLLKKLDKDLNIFGASSHEYNLNPVINNDEIIHFEKENKVKLPIDYIEFFN